MYCPECKMEFKAIYIENNTISKNSFSIEELASHEEHEWAFEDGTTLPANDVEPGDLKYVPASYAENMREK